MSEQFIAWLDAGHGGHDSGAVGPNGLRESDVALAVVLRAGAVLEAAGVRVMYSRESDVFLSLSERAERANKAGADVFVSDHCNSAPNPASGIETFAMTGSVNGEKLATYLQDEMLDNFPGSKDRGVKFARLSVLRRTVMPAALVENEFMHTLEGEAHFDDPNTIIKCGDAIADGVMKFLGVMKVTAEPAKMVVKGERQKPEASATLLENRVKHLEAENADLRAKIVDQKSQIEDLHKEALEDAKMIDAARKALG